ncbi:MAG TPA: SIS domain-containing protein [Candidatus Angelobacter sp.]|nr:SIS domain-containing protein [Candidatus Angelobacter sp.]
MNRELNGQFQMDGSLTFPSVKPYFQALSALIEKVPHMQIGEIVSVILKAYDEERALFVFGNGGSAATASHIVCDLNKGATVGLQGKRFRMMALTDNVPLLTAWANDAAYDRVFAEQLRNFVRPRDVVFAISSSGNSENVLQALRVGRELGAIQLGIAGGTGGAMKDLCDVCAVVPSDNIQLVEDLHHAIAHSIAAVVREELLSRGEGSRAASAGSAGR